MWIEDSSFKEAVGLKSNLRSWINLQKVESSNDLTFNTQHLKKFISEYTSSGQIWGIFKSFKNEPVIDWEQFKDLGLRFVFPKIETDSSQKEDLTFFDTQNFEKTRFGILEPVGGQPIEAARISGLFIPGLAFDVRGTRLGRGRGHYDLFLKDFNGIKVGLTWSRFFLQASIPKESWDIPMDFILTEKFLYQPLFEHKED
jgi:5-formyltetrahydrofolate cyclo-ligase